MKSIILLAALISLTSNAQFTSETVKKIDKIENNSSSDITLDPTNQVVIPYLNTGELIIDDGTGLQSLANGLEGQLLSITGGVLDFIDPPLSSPTTTIGDIIYNNTGTNSGDTRLAIGTVNQLLSSNGTIPVWVDPPSTSPTTTEGDLILRGATEDVRLPIGLADYLLTSNGTTASWQPAPVSTTLTTKGDIQTYDTANARLPVGLDGTFLVADSTEPTGLKYTASLQGKLNPVTDWEIVACDGTWSTNVTYSCKKKRIGDSLHVTGTISITGTPDNTNLFLNIPESLTIDESKINTVSVQKDVFGIARYLDSGLALAMGQISYQSSTQVHVSLERITGNNDTAQVNATTPTVWVNNDAIYFNYSVPIQGWTSGLDASVQNIQLTAQTDNSFKFNVSNAGVVSGDTLDYVNGDCTVNSAGFFTCNWNSSIFTEAPKCNVSITQVNSQTINAVIDGISSTAVSYKTYALNDGSQSFNSRGVTIGCEKTGADYNKSQVIAGTFENIDSSDLVMFEANNNSGTGVVAAVTNIPFTNEVKDPLNAWSGSEYTAQKAGRYNLVANIAFTSIATRAINLFYAPVSTGVYSLAKRLWSSSTALPSVSTQIDLEVGDKIALRSDSAGTLSSSSTEHYISITQSADYEAIVKNLYNEKTECVGKSLQTSVTTAGAMADLTQTMTIGKKYRYHGQVSFTSLGNMGIFDGSTRIGEAYAGSSNPYMGVGSKCFVATSTSFEVHKLGGSGQINGGANPHTTYIELCELPDSTICTSDI